MHWYPVTKPANEWPISLFSLRQHEQNHKLPSLDATHRLVTLHITAKGSHELLCSLGHMSTFISKPAGSNTMSVLTVSGLSNPVQCCLHNWRLSCSTLLLRSELQVKIWYCRENHHSWVLVLSDSSNLFQPSAPAPSPQPQSQQSQWRN